MGLRTKMYRGMPDVVDISLVVRLPSFCPVCGSACLSTGEYPHARRCTGCSGYFHRAVLTCLDLEREGYDPRNCNAIDHRNPSKLRLFTLNDGRLVETCSTCRSWLFRKGFMND